MIAMEKRGQVTLFVIVGILIVVLVSIGIYYRANIANVFREDQLVQDEAFAQNTDVLKNYISSCLAETTTQGADLLGLQGGYIHLPEDPLAIENTGSLSNKLVMLPGLDVAYWYYETQNGIQKTQIPSNDYMQEELENYVEENIDNCLREFSGFEAFTINKGTLNAQIKINSDTITSTLNYPLKITQEENLVQLKTFQETLDIPLGKLYDSATSIMNKENKETFLEEKTLDQFVVYDELPYSGVDFACTPQTWQKAQVYQDLRNILNTNIAHLRVKGSNYERIEGQEYFELDNVDANKGTSISFMYNQEWPMLVDITPDDQLLRGESYNDNSLGRFITQFFCLNYYNFVYDLTYPVVISLTDDTTGYTFQYATQVIIKRNQPRENKVTEEYLDGTTNRACEHPITPIQATVQGYGSRGSVVALDKADLSINCVGATCPLGVTNQGTVTALAPQCINANIIARHEGYHQSNEIIDTIEPQTLTILLEPKKELNLTVGLVRAEQGGARGIIQGEIILVQFVNTERAYSTSILYPEQRSITLISGDYEVKTTVIKDSAKPLTIKGETTTTCIQVPRSGILGSLGLTEKKCQETELKGTTVNSVIVGGANFEYTLDRDALLRSKQLTVYTVRNTEPTTITELQKLYDQIEHNAENTNFKEPLLQ